MRSRSCHPLFLLSCGAVFLPCFMRFVVFLGVIKTNDVLRRVLQTVRKTRRYNSPPQLCTPDPLPSLLDVDQRDGARLARPLWV